MPIRVECPKCGDVSHFADNDAGLVVACLGCRARLKVPAASSKPAPPPPPMSDAPEHRPLFSTDVASAPPPAAAPQQRPTAPTRRPATHSTASRGRWRAYTFLALILVIGAVATLQVRNYFFEASPVIAQTESPTPKPAPANAAPKSAAAPDATPATKAAPATPVEPPPPPAPVVATYTPANAPVGFVGLDRIEFNGQLLVDSYDAAAGPYDAASAHENAILQSNGPIALTGEGHLHGSVHLGRAARFKPAKKISVTRPASPLPEPLYAPPVMLDPFAHDSMNDALPEPFFKAGNLALAGNATLSLAPGVYYLNDVTIDVPATLRCEGPVTLLVAGRLTLGGTIATAGNLPANCRIRLTGEQPATISSKAPLHIDLYAPLSQVDLTGQGDLFGAIVAKNLRVAGNRPLHMDESLAAGR